MASVYNKWMDRWTLWIRRIHRYFPLLRVKTPIYPEMNPERPQFELAFTETPTTTLSCGGAGLCGGCFTSSAASQSKASGFHTRCGLKIHVVWGLLYGFRLRVLVWGFSGLKKAGQ